eukprot:gene6304-4109_t
MPKRRQYSIFDKIASGIVDGGLWPDDDGTVRAAI